MTRRALLIEIGKSSGFVLGAVGLFAGCGGGTSNETGSQVVVSPERQAELDAQKKATEEFYAKKKK